MFICKLYYFEEYETPIGRQYCECNGESFRRYKYEKIKTYFQEKKFKTHEEAWQYGNDSMYFDTEIDGYDIEEIN